MKWKERAKDFLGMSLYDHQRELMEWERVFDELESKIEEGNEVLSVETSRSKKKKKRGKHGEVIDDYNMSEEDKKSA